MGVGHISQLPIDIFLKIITYLPYQSVIALAITNRKLRNYSSLNYSSRWKCLTIKVSDDRSIKRLQQTLKYSQNQYDYKIYARSLIERLDPITRCMIYYQQKDMDSFDRFDMGIKFLALFLLILRNKKIIDIMNYIPRNCYDPVYPYSCFVAYLHKRCIAPNDTIGSKLEITDSQACMLEFVRWNNVEGMLLFSHLLSNDHCTKIAFETACSHNSLNIVQYIMENVPNFQIVTNGKMNNDGLKFAVDYGFLNIVKYLLEKQPIPEMYLRIFLVTAKKFGKSKVANYLEQLIK